MMGIKDSIKDTITSNFMDKMWDDKELEGKRKLRYYKGVINSTLDTHNYLSMLSINKKKMNIANIKTNSHELRSDTGWWSIPKTPSNDRICQICDSKQVEDEKHFLLDCPTLTHIRSQFPTICHTSSLANPPIVISEHLFPFSLTIETRFWRIKLRLFLLS